MTLPSPFHTIGHGPARKGDNLASLPAPSARTTLAHLAPERRERDHGRAICTGPFVSTRTVGRVSLNSEMGSKPEARPSAFHFQSARPSRAVCAGGLADLLPRRGFRRFQFVRAVKVARHLFSVRVHSASRVRQNPTPRTILDRAASATTNMLDSALAEESRLVGMIDNLTEELRQTRAVIEAFSPVTEKLVAASDPAPVKAKAKKPAAIAAE